LEHELTAHAASRTAQKRLARELTALVHGAPACDDAVRASEVLFGGGLEGVTERVFAEITGEVPTTTLPPSRFEGAGVALADLVVDAGLCPSKGQARKDIAAGGIYVNNVRETAVQRHVTGADLLYDRHLLLRKGKRNYVLVSAGSLQPVAQSG
jgi:tyrosyl-tRNA synthetase